MNPILEYKDIGQFQEALNDQDSMLMEIEVNRCTAITRNDAYPGDKPTIVRTVIYTRAEIKVIPIGEIEDAGGILMAGDLLIRTGIELRGSNQKDPNDVGDKTNPETIADVLTLSPPYQGQWFVVGIPEPGELLNLQAPIFRNVNIRRIKIGAKGK